MVLSEGAHLRVCRHPDNLENSLLFPADEDAGADGIGVAE